MKRAREPRSNHPVQTGFLPNLRRAPDHQAGPPQELFPAVADLFVQRLWGIFRFSCRTERRQISSASNCSHLVPLQPGSHSRGGRTAYRNGASHYRSAANHLTLDFGVPTHHHVPSATRCGHPPIPRRHARGANAKSPTGLPVQSPLGEARANGRGGASRGGGEGEELSAQRL